MHVFEFCYIRYLRINLLTSVHSYMIVCSKVKGWSREEQVCFIVQTVEREKRTGNTTCEHTEKKSTCIFVGIFS